MSRSVRWLLSGVALLVVVVLALPFVLPGGVFKQQIIEATQRATGRVMAIDGELSISFWPTFGVVAEKVHLANVPGAELPDMLSMERLVVGAELFPLLSGTLNVTQIKLVNPVINLEVDRQGVGNWVFTAKEAAPASAGTPAAASGESAFSFRDVEVSGGVLTYRNARSGLNEKVEAVDAVIKLPSLDQAMSLQGGLTWHSQAIALSMNVANPRALMKNFKSGLSAKISGAPVSMSFDGEAGADGVSGAIAAQGNSARALAAFIGASLPPGQGFGKFALSGDVSTRAGVVEMKDARLSLDGMNGRGGLTLDQRKATPHLKGSMNFDRLNLDPYLGGGPRDAAAGGGGVPAWGEARLDLSALHLMDADLVLAAEALSAGKLGIGKCVLALGLSSGKLRANLKQLELYGGTGKGVITLDEVASTPRLGVELSINGVQAEPFLTDATGFQRLTGLGDLMLRVMATGHSQAGLMRSLGGTAQFRFTDGTIKGVNLAEIARTISSVLTGNAVSPAASTDFSELSGTFVIKNGVAANKDLKLAGPFVRMNGAGLIDVGSQQMDYRVTPKVVATDQGQGGNHDIAGIGVPFRIAGPWSSLSYQPDLTGTATTAIDAILNGRNPLDALKGNGGLGGLFGAPSSPPPAPNDGTTDPQEPAKVPEKPNPLSSIKDIFGGGH